MKKILLEIELTYDDEIVHGSDQVAIAWFHNNVLLGQGESSEDLILHSNEIGDEVGIIKVLKINST